jgi:hypothetical protein
MTVRLLLEIVFDAGRLMLWVDLAFGYFHRFLQNRENSRVS